MSYGDYRKNKFESALLYQDFVVDAVSTLLGLNIQLYASRAYQVGVGESRTGAEIKHDEKYKRTGNLWIELSEKAEPRPGDYAVSGIHRNDNAWLWIQGDYDKIFIFPKRYLIAISPRYPNRENHTKTSIGFLLPGKDAEKYAAAILTPNAEQKIAKHVRDLEAFGRELHEELKNETIGQISLFTRLTK